MYLYSAQTNAFYPFVLKNDYVAAGMWPESGVEIDENTFAEFQTPNHVKVRLAGDDGYPVWGDAPKPTDEQLVAIAKAKKQLLINQANEYINNKQWPGKAVLGRLKNSDKAQYNAWLDYLEALEALDTSSAPDIKWPTSPGEKAS